METIQNVWWLLVLIGVMILIHEAGHFWAARFFDVRVEAFSFGFGPRLFGFRSGETDFRFSAILFGGYVKMAGEQPGEDNADDPRSFLSKPRWQRLIIAFAGPFMNIVLAIALLTGLYMVRYPKLPVVNSPTVGWVAQDGPAAKAGFQEGDRIVQIESDVNPNWEDIITREVSSAKQALHVFVERNGSRQMIVVTPTLDEKTGIGYIGWAEQSDVQLAGVMPGKGADKAGLKAGDRLIVADGKPIRAIPRLHEVIRGSEGRPVAITFLRAGKEQTVTVTPTKSSADGTERWMIGVSLENRYVITQLSFPDALAESVRQNIRGASLIYKFLQGIGGGRMSPKSIEGPLRIAQLSGEAAREGATAYFGLMAAVSLNLAIFNLLPIPILDGGVILLLLVEMLMRRDLSLAVKEAVFKAGFVFLMAVVVFVLYNDITKILAG